MQIDRKDCIEWPHLDAKGYGRIRRKLAHRVKWQEQRGDIPPGMLVCHHCDNPACVNVEHLFLGTYSDNAKDRESKGRGRPTKGAQNGHSTISELTAVRLKMLRGALSSNKVVGALPISRKQICWVMTDHAWKHVSANTRYAF